MNKANIGLIGLAVMGANIARNIADKGFTISVFNRTTQVTDDFIKQFGTESITGYSNLEEFVMSLELPRKIIILVKAGEPVDKVIEQLTQYIDKSDIIIDLGNSNFKDTIRRESALREQGFRFIGSGVSGGEEGALNGPSLMPGGENSSWQEIKAIFEAIAAKDFSGGACVTHIGENGAGHYVKMVHNGIEYGIMQILAETYALLSGIYNMSAPEISQVFNQLNKGKLESFLVEISAEVTAKQDEHAEGYLIDKVLDVAGNKGTGKWTVIDALENGVPSSVISAGVDARLISTYHKLRQNLSKQYNSEPEYQNNLSKQEFISLLEDSLYTAILCSYAQGYDMISTAAKAYDWQIDLAEVSRIWQGGCIIRAKVLVEVSDAFASQSSTSHLFTIPLLEEEISSGSKSLRKLVIAGTQAGVPISAFSSALNYYDSITKSKLSANFIQALRDNFGAHTYERTDMDGEFHSDWKSNN